MIRSGKSCNFIFDKYYAWASLECFLVYYPKCTDKRSYALRLKELKVSYMIHSVKFTDFYTVSPNLINNNFLEKKRLLFFEYLQEKMPIIEAERAEVCCLFVPLIPPVFFTSEPPKCFKIRLDQRFSNFFSSGDHFH